MKYIEVEEDSQKNANKQGFFKKMLTYFFGESKFDKISDRVAYWWIEVNDENCPTREIAFDKTNNSIWTAPLKDERGVFVDSSCLFKDDWKNEKNIEINFNLIRSKFIYIDLMIKKLNKKQFEFYKMIDRILWNDWDPIGVNDVGNARDEYYFYLEESFKLALSKDKSELIEYLFNVEKSDMGLSTCNKDRCEKIANLIFKAKNDLGL